MAACMVQESSGLCSAAEDNCGSFLAVPFFVLFTVIGTFMMLNIFTAVILLNFQSAALDEGLLLRPIGPTLYFMPPYVLGEAEQRHLAEGALRVLDRVLAEEGSSADQASEVPVP